VRALGDRSGITVTGSVDDVRPHVTSAALSVVPLRIGGGTRLKIYECMAARLAVVSTHIGAEGLEVTDPENIRLVDSCDEFAARCVELLEAGAERARMAESAWRLVSSRFSSEQVALRFEQILQAAPGSRQPPDRSGAVLIS
jgi:glycosyltransferase involved in cell wall biosynthesis